MPLNAFGGQQEMINACESIPGISECSRPGSSSFWVFMSTPNQPHPYNDYGSMLCNGGATKFGVPKGYSITFWNPNTKKQLAKFIKSRNGTENKRSVSKRNERIRIHLDIKKLFSTAS